MVWIGKGVLKVGSKDKVKYIGYGEEIPSSIDKKVLDSFIKKGVIGESKEIKKVEPKKVVKDENKIQQ